MAEQKHGIAEELKKRIREFIAWKEEEYCQSELDWFEAPCQISVDQDSVLNAGTAPEAAEGFEDRICESVRPKPAANRRRPGKEKAAMVGSTPAIHFSALAMSSERMSFPEPEGTFVEELRTIIRDRDIREPELYHAVNMDHKLFNKIINDVNYHPKKTTALQLCIGLNLSLEETQDLIKRAGYALTHSSRFDIIVEYFLTNRIYDIFLINETLYEFDQPLFFGAR